MYLLELGASDKPVIYVYNKCDKAEAFTPKTPVKDSYFISALTGDGVDVLVKRLEETAHNGTREYVLNIPHSDLGVLGRLYDNTVVKSVEYTDFGAVATVVADRKNAGVFAKYIEEREEKSES